MSVQKGTQCVFVKVLHDMHTGLNISIRIELAHDRIHVKKIECLHGTKLVNRWVCQELYVLMGEKWFYHS